MHDCSGADPSAGHGTGIGGCIGPKITESYKILPGRTASRLVMVCDHANNAFPPGYGTLGLPAGQLVRHIVYDIGAAEVTRRLSEKMSAPAVLTHYSRLLIDPNRGLDDPTLIMRISDGAVVPGNRALSPHEHEKRVREYYEPYHGAIDKVLEACVASGNVPVLLSIHSFTDIWRGEMRPWHAAVLWDKDPRLALPLLEGLSASGDFVIGDNEPYSGRLQGDCMWRHGTMAGFAHALIELRQDLIQTEEGQEAWASRLASILSNLMRDKSFLNATGRLEVHNKNADISNS